MDANDISSTCENDSTNRDGSCVEKDELEDGDYEFDSDNESIDICENSEHSVNKASNKNYKHNNSFTGADKLFFFEQNRVIFPNKSLVNANVCDSEPSQSGKNIINGNSKTFLIDSILGNNKSSDSEAEVIFANDADSFEETADERNGEKRKTIHILKK